MDILKWLKNARDIIASVTVIGAAAATGTTAAWKWATKDIYTRINNTQYAVHQVDSTVRVVQKAVEVNTIVGARADSALLAKLTVTDASLRVLLKESKVPLRLKW